MNPLVSVIIPVYNVEKYLARCVDSVLAQTYPNVEIILVDDGSPDSSGAICDEYAALHENVQVVHKKNGGLASARNAGMRVATGEYLFFIDSDDWIDPETLQELVEIGEKTGVDFVRYTPVYAGWPNHADGEMYNIAKEKVLHEGIFTKENIVRDIYPRLFAQENLDMGVIVSACRSLYKTSFLKAHNLVFDESIKYAEDTYFSAKLVYHTNSFYFVGGGKYYHYFYNPASITKSYKKDRWDSGKKLIAAFEKEFSNKPDYDFTDQLSRLQIFAVLDALNQKKFLPLKQRLQYCKGIIGDPITREAFQHIDLIKISQKRKIRLWLIRLNLWAIYAVV